MKESEKSNDPLKRLTRFELATNYEN
jgi:hypothetical protein